MKSYGIMNNTRSKLLLKNIVFSFLLKGWSALVVLLMIPLTLKMLGIYQNGVWLTISSILIWINLMDVGLGNGLRNAVAENIAAGQDDKVREAISSTFFMLIVLVVPMLVCLYFIIGFFDMHAALGISMSDVPNLDAMLNVAVTLTAVTFILKATGNFYMGLQLPAVNNLIVCIGQTLSLIFTYVAYLIGIYSLLAVIVINTATPLFVWAICTPYTFRKRYPQYRPRLRTVSLSMSRKLCSLGVQFFAIQVCGLVLLSSTNIIISKLFSPAEVTPYQVALRYFNLAFIAFSTICMPFWNAATDAYARNDIQWIHKVSRKLDLLMVGVFAVLVVMVLLSDFIYGIWVGNEVSIPLELSVSTAIYIFILTLSQRYSYILNGLNALKIQMVFTIIAAIIFLPLAVIVCKGYGTVTSLVCVMCVVNIPGLMGNIWKYRQILYVNGINETKDEVPDIRTKT